MMLTNENFNVALDALHFYYILPDLANNATEIDKFFKSRNDDMILRGVYERQGFSGVERIPVTNMQDVVKVLLREGVLVDNNGQYEMKPGLSSVDPRFIDIMTSIFFGVNNNIEGLLNDSEGSIQKARNIEYVSIPPYKPGEKSLVEQILPSAVDNFGNGILPHVLLACLTEVSPLKSWKTFSLSCRLNISISLMGRCFTSNLRKLYI